MVLDDLADGTPEKSGISMLSLQRMLEIKSFKTVWTISTAVFGNRKCLTGCFMLVSIQD